MVFELHPTSSRSNSKHLPFKFQFGELVLIINCKWEAWVMGLTFPWEPCFLGFYGCYFQRWHLGGAGALQTCHLHMPLHTTGISLLPQSHLHPCILNENAIALQSVFTYGAWVTGCLFENSAIFILPASTLLVIWIFHSSSTHYLQLYRCFIWWTRWIYHVPLALSLPDPLWWAYI